MTVDDVAQRKIRENLERARDRLGKARKGVPPGMQEVGRTVLDDLLHGKVHNTLRRDLDDLYDFYVDEERRRQLAAMGRVRRTIVLTAWLLKSLILRLPPARRILLLLALVLVLMGHDTLGFPGMTVEFYWTPVAFLILLLILMLELKDKLLAQDELEVGRAVQLALMPQASPRVPGWDVWLYTRPANDVGGDMVDCLQVGHERWGIALGDVAGKGLGAALLMAKLQATLRAVASDGAPLADLGARINAILCRDGIQGRFATMAYLEIQADADAVRVLNAGHIPPVLVGPAGAESLRPVAVPLGAFPNARYQEQGISVPPGSLLVVYSDGLTEAMDGKGEFFGEERVLRLLPELRTLDPQAAGGRLLAEVDAFVGEARRFDDLSLVLLRRTGASAPVTPEPPPAAGSAGV